MFHESLEAKLIRAKKQFPELEITKSAISLKGILRLKAPTEIIVLSEIIKRPFFTEFDSPIDFVIQVDAGDVWRLSSEGVCKIVNLLQYKKVHFTSMTVKLLETLSYVDMNLKIVGLDEMIVETMKDEKRVFKFSPELTVIKLEEMAGEELDICSDVFEGFKEYYITSVGSK